MFLRHDFLGYQLFIDFIVTVFNKNQNFSKATMLKHISSPVNAIEV